MHFIGATWKWRSCSRSTSTKKVSRRCSTTGRAGAYTRRRAGSYTTWRWRAGCGPETRTLPMSSSSRSASSRW
uniref:Uncharacterized protein n=1 Tax=Arundo donax TaxID=35708 RepID=A0A0A9AUR1_ARUDO